METKFNFKSAICTSIGQSERLLELGLKKETADMIWLDHVLTDDYVDWRTELIPKYWNGCLKDDIPAWSLHRLLSMLPDNAPKIYWVLDGTNIYIEFEDEDINFFSHKGDIYEGVINRIEWLIKKGYFNKEYLENEMEEKV